MGIIPFFDGGYKPDNYNNFLDLFINIIILIMEMR